MDIKKEHNEARFKFQSRLNEISEPWKEIPTNEIPEPLKDFAQYLLSITTFLDEEIDTSDQRKNISFKKSEDIWLLKLLTNWIETNPVITDQDKKEYSGTVGAIRLAMQFFAANVILDINNTGLSLDDLSAKLKGTGTIMAEQSKMERRLRDIENELGFLVALGVESSTMPKGDLRHLPTDLDRESLSNEIYNTFKKRRGDDKVLLSRKRKDQLR